MPIVTLRLPEVKYSQKTHSVVANSAVERPSCTGVGRQNGSVIHAWEKSGCIVIAVIDAGKHPGITRQGIDRARQTTRMRALVAIGWILGMCYRGSSCYLSAFGVVLSRMNIWRNVQQRAEQFERDRSWKPVRVLGMVEPKCAAGERPIGLSGSVYVHR